LRLEADRVLNHAENTLQAYHSAWSSLAHVRPSRDSTETSANVVLRS
jgi:hypothetical protein